MDSDLFQSIRDFLPEKVEIFSNLGIRPTQFVDYTRRRPWSGLSPLFFELSWDSILLEYKTAKISLKLKRLVRDTLMASMDIKMIESDMSFTLQLAKKL